MQRYNIDPRAVINATDDGAPAYVWPVQRSAAKPRWSDYAGPPTTPGRRALSTEAKVGIAAAALGVAVGLALITASAAQDRDRRKA